MKSVTIEALSRPACDLARIKQKIRQNQLKSKQYNSLCYDITQESTQPTYHQHEEKVRKPSRKDGRNHQSSKKLIRSYSRCTDKSSCKNEDKNKQNIGALYGELMAVKSQYKKLKGSYEKLAQEKLELTNRGQGDPSEYKARLQETVQEVLRQERINQALQQELQRIRKECLRVVETEKFKNKKLEQIIQEKDLMISFLRRQIERPKKGNECSSWSTANQSAIMFYQNISNYGLNSSQISSSNIVVEPPKISRIEQDSLCFSRDHSKQMQSINSLLTYNDPRKECVVIEPKTTQLFSSEGESYFREPSQCLTFEQREEDPAELKNIVKMPPRTNKKPIMSKPKSSKLHRRPNFLTLGDQNADVNSKCGQSVEHKLLGNSKHRKKNNSSRKRI